MAAAISKNSPKPATPPPGDDQNKADHKNSPVTTKQGAVVTKSIAPGATASTLKVEPSSKAKAPVATDTKAVKQVGNLSTGNGFAVSFRAKTEPTQTKAGDVKGDQGKTFTSTGTTSAPLSLVSAPQGKAPANNGDTAHLKANSQVEDLKAVNPKGEGAGRLASTSQFMSVKLGSNDAASQRTNTPLSLAAAEPEGGSGPGAGSETEGQNTPGQGGNGPTTGPGSATPPTGDPPDNGNGGGSTTKPPPSRDNQPVQGKNPGSDTPQSLGAGRPLGDQSGMPSGVVPRNRMLTGKDLQQNATNEFTRDPASFAASYFVNTMSNFVMPGRTVPDARPGQTVDGSDNIVGFTMNRVDDRNVEMTVTGRPSELGRQGTPSSALAYYVPFTNGGATTVRVPRNPTAGDPQFVVTGPFTGCSFYVQQDPNDPNSLLFTHDPRRGVGTTTSPTGIPDGAVGMGYDSHYGNNTGMSPLSAPSATAFAAYDQGTRRWTMYVQDATVDLPPPGTRSGGSVQRQREEGRIQGAFIPIDFSTPSGPPANLDQPGTSNPQQLAPESSFWAAFRNGALTGAAIGGAAGVETGPGAAVTAGGGALLGGTIAGMAWLFSWTQHHATHP